MLNTDHNIPAKKKIQITTGWVGGKAFIRTCAHQAFWVKFLAHTQKNKLAS